MHDVRDQVRNVWRVANRMQGRFAGARSLMFVSARSGEGVTSFAASLAVLASHRADKPVWLVDLDVRRNAAYAGFQDRTFEGLGPPGRPVNASMRQTPVFSVTPSLVSNEDQKLLCGHALNDGRLYVTRFRGEYLHSGQSVNIVSAPDWWQALKGVSDWIIVDTPALERSSAALTVAGQMDAVIIVVEADQTSAQDVSEVRREIEAYGGHVIGLVMNKIQPDAGLIHRLMR